MAAATKPALVTQPIAQPQDEGTLAPWPAIDKYPVVIGPGLSLQYISSIFRLSLIGYRQQYVDLLDEMLEKDPHAFSVLEKRVLSVSGGQIEIVAAKTSPGSQDEQLAKELRDFCADMIEAIPDFDQHLAALAWAVFFAIVGLENHWVRDGRGWFLERMSFIHSRRLSYPVAGSWDLYVWDQGQVLPFTALGTSPTNAGVYGLRVADNPGKFVIYAPQIRGNYPTREGLGRQIAYWMALKLVAARNAPQYLEQFAKPTPEGTYSTETTKDGRVEKRPATKEDIANADAALKSMGAGRLSSWLHPDTIKLDLRTPDSGSVSKITFTDWINICNSEISKAVVGGTLSTEVGSTGGNRSLGETQRKGELALYKYDAKLLAATLRRDVLSWMVRLNFPNVPMRLVPRVKIQVEDPPDPMTVIERASKGASAGVPVDADKIAEQTGLPVVAAGDTKARRMFPIAQVKDPAAYDADLAAREMVAKPAETDTQNADTQGASPNGEDTQPDPEEEV